MQTMDVASASTWPTLDANLPTLFPVSSLAPMAQTWRPMFVADTLTFKRDKTSSAISFAIHAIVVTLVLFLAVKTRTVVLASPTPVVTQLDIRPYTPAVILPIPKPMGGGGGGGAHDLVDANKGHLPTVVMPQFAPPQIRMIDRPKLAMEPSAQVRIPDNSNLPSLGISQSPQIRMASQGSGSGSGFGQSSGGGIGSGRGTGAGSGSGGGYGGGLMSVGGGVSAPQVIHSVDPEFTDDARRANYQGNVSITLIVDSQGNPQNVRLASHLGMGLEQKAIDAVKQYRFKPAMYEGHPVSVQIVIDVDFRLH